MVTSSAPRPARTLLEVVRLAAGYLAGRGVERPRLDAELLIARALGVRRIDLYLQYDRPLTEAELAAVRELLRRRARGEPVAYLLGEREFFGRPFVVTPAVLVPRPETETLVEVVLEWARARRGRVRIADVGTGSGCLAVTLAAELPEATVVASDLSEEAVSVAAENASRHDVQARVEAVVGSWGEPLVGRGPFDVVVSNPPYVATAEIADLPRDVRDFEPRLALDAGADGLVPYRALLPGIAPVLGTPALVAIEVDPRRAGQVAAMAAAVWPRARVITRRDLAGAERVVVVEVSG